MKKHSELTVVIPAKDEHGTLLRLLDCLKRQSYQNFDIIVSDSSEDMTVRNICIRHAVRYIRGGYREQLETTEQNKPIASIFSFLTRICTLDLVLLLTRLGQ